MATDSQSAFEPEVRAYEEADRRIPPPKAPVLFYGSSSLRFWPDLARDFPGRPVLNRGFGGATFDDCLQFFDRLVKPHAPRVIVLYAGENDLVHGRKSGELLDRLRQLIERVRRELPSALLAVISLKPSPAYQGNFAAIQETNTRIREMTSGLEKATYLDVFGKMLQPDGNCRPELFQGDGVHMAPAGYAVWKEVVLSYLNGEGAGFPRKSHRWYSPRLEREMEVLTIGGAGRGILVFPTLYGTPYQYEELGMVEALRERLEGGQMQLFCLDNVDLESFYNKQRAPGERVLRHMRFEQYVLEEVLPFTAWQNANPALTAHGCSLGAFHAVNIALRHPLRFTQVVAFSGRYDLTRSFGGFANLMDGYYDDNVYFNTPCHYMANLTDPELLAQIRRLDITIAIGESDAFIENNQAFSRILWDKGIWHAFRVYQGYAHSPHRWCEMVKLFL